MRSSWPLIYSNGEQNRICQFVINSINRFQILGFIQGKAGTGKSFLIKHLINLFTIYKIPFLVCASTGIAASLIDGLTAHSAFSIFTDTEGNSVSGVKIQTNRGIALSKIKFLIIDEITMLSKSTLESINNVMKTLSNAVHNHNHNNPFGGCSVLLFGDMAQVPAISNHNDDYQEARNQFNNISCWDYFQTFALNRVIRQDPDQIQLLSILD